MNWHFSWRKGMRYLAQNPHWKVTAPEDFRRFLRSLPMLLPEGSVVCLEGQGASPAQRAYLQSRRPRQVMKLPRGTLLPRTDMFHMAASQENLDGLASLFQAETGIPTHIQAYNDARILIQWFDASAGDPIFLSKEIPESKIQSFCRLISSNYK